MRTKLLACSSKSDSSRRSAASRRSSTAEAAEESKGSATSPAPSASTVDLLQQLVDLSQTRAFASPPQLGSGTLVARLSEDGLTYELVPHRLESEKGPELIPASPDAVLPSARLVSTTGAGFVVINSASGWLS